MIFKKAKFKKSISWLEILLENVSLEKFENFDSNN